MKMKHGLILAATLCAGLAAQHLFADDQPGTAPPSGTQPAKNKKAAKKKSATAPKKSAAAAAEPMKPVPVTAGPAVVTQPSVNVRGQAAINSEVVVRLKKGDHVNVLE